MQAVASAPELYPELVRLGAVPGLLALLGHENGDLAASVAELLRELTDADAVEDSARPGWGLQHYPDALCGTSGAAARADRRRCRGVLGAPWLGCPTPPWCLMGCCAS